MTVTAVKIVKAAGLMGWVAAVQYKDGWAKELLDLDIQHKDPLVCLEMAEDEYPEIPVNIEADPFWTKGIPEKYLAK